jgi:tripartite-type tricarboxylate transporter receptor subunit TctC
MNIPIGIDALSNTPEQFAAYIRDETAKWGAVIKEANVRVE